jgi:hypothetical protein
MEAPLKGIEIRTGLAELLRKSGVSTRIQGYFLYRNFMSLLSHSKDLPPMVDYLAFGLRRKRNDICGQTIDFNRSNFVLKETDRLPMRSGSHGRIVSKVGNQ